LTFDLLTLKVVSELHVTWATSVPIFVFLGLSVLELGPMYATDRQTDVRQKHRLMPLRYWGGGIIRGQDNIRNTDAEATDYIRRICVMVIHLIQLSS